MVAVDLKPDQDNLPSGVQLTRTAARFVGIIPAAKDLNSYTKLKIFDRTMSACSRPCCVAPQLLADSLYVIQETAAVLRVSALAEAAETTIMYGSAVSPSLQVVIIRSEIPQIHSWSHLLVTEQLFRDVLINFDVNPRFLGVVRCFGGKITPSEESLAKFFVHLSNEAPAGSYRGYGMYRNFREADISHPPD